MAAVRFDFGGVRNPRAISSNSAPITMAVIGLNRLDRRRTRDAVESASKRTDLRISILNEIHRASRLHFCGFVRDRTEGRHWAFLPSRLNVLPPPIVSNFWTPAFAGVRSDRGA